MIKEVTHKNKWKRANDKPMIKEVTRNNTGKHKQTIIMGFCFIADGLIRILSLGRLWSTFAHRRAWWQLTNDKF